MDKTYGEKIKDALEDEELLKSLGPLVQPREIEKSIESIIEQCVFSTINHIEKNGLDAIIECISKSEPNRLTDLTNDLKKSIYKEKGGKGFYIYNDYQKMHSRYHRIIDIEKKQSNYDLTTRRRYVRYRTYTTACIAAVILATGYISNKCGIPLPLSGQLKVAESTSKKTCELLYPFCNG
jgi:methyltransferase-like protein